MIIGFGEHKGKAAESVVLKHGSYIHWVLSEQNPFGPLLALRAEVERLIILFDKKAFLKLCVGVSCHRTAVRVTAPRSNWSSLFFWCDFCDPRQFGAEPGSLRAFSGYRYALSYVLNDCHADKDGYNAVIRKIAIAKGLPEQSTAKQDIAFFQQ